MGSPPQHAGLQALRGILALMVFAEHVFGITTALVPHDVAPLASWRLGHVAVLVFFALSGFLIAGKAGDPAAKFALDRARRIVPMFWLALAAATALNNGLVFRLSQFPWDVAFLLPDGEKNRFAMPHWSLHFECIFYALVFVVARARVSWVRPAIVVWGLVSFALYTRPYHFDRYAAPDLYNLLFPVYGIFFAVGIAAGWRFTARPGWTVPYAALATIAFFGRTALGMLGVAVPSWVHITDVVYAQLAVGTFFAIRAALCWSPGRFFGRALKIAGDASYGIYLVHLMAIIFAVEMLKRTGPPSSYGEALASVTAIALPIAFAYGMLDVLVQKALKRIQVHFRSRRAIQPLPAAQA